LQKDFSITLLLVSEIGHGEVAELAPHAFCVCPIKIDKNASEQDKHPNRQKNSGF
jgi:hypothetical protein